MIEWKQRVQKLHQNHIKKSTWRTRQYFVDFESRIDVIISVWLRLSKSTKFRRTFHMEFRRRIDGESTKMCPLGTSCFVFLAWCYFYQTMD